MLRDPNSFKRNGQRQMKPFRVILVEDDAALRASLTDWLSKEYLITQFESAENMLEALNNFELEDEVPTCILLDFQMPGMNGVELQTTLKEMNIELPIIFTSGNAQQADIIDAWHGGANDFLLKPFTGEMVSQVLKTLFQQSSAMKLAAASMPISKREAQVLMLIGKGYRQQEIADLLNITLRTVKWHRTGIKNKLGLNTLVEIARYCDQNKSLLEKAAQSHSS